MRKQLPFVRRKQPLVVAANPACYRSLMTKDQIKAVLDRVLTWPSERQEDAAKVLESMEAQDKTTYRLTEKQAAEVQRRRAETDPKTLSLAEFNDRLRPYGE
jgi:hypothetical protein